MGTASRKIREELYRLRFLSSLALSLLVVLAFFHFWPHRNAPDLSHTIFSVRGKEVVQIEDMAPTRQQARKPPPPAPLPPVPVPDDFILPEEELTFTSELSLETLTDEGPDERTEAGTTGNGALLAIEEGPRPVRFVEPEYTPAARKRKIRAQIVVEVLVDEHGRVTQARIVERFLLSKNPDEPPVPVDTIGYGLEQAALTAAQRWRFRPARKNGTPVKTFTTLTFRFGV